MATEPALMLVLPLDEPDGEPAAPAKPSKTSSPSVLDGSSDDVAVADLVDEAVLLAGVGFWAPHGLSSRQALWQAALLPQSSTHCVLASVQM